MRISNWKKTIVLCLSLSLCLGTVAEYGLRGEAKAAEAGRNSTVSENNLAQASTGAVVSATGSAVSAAPTVTPSPTPVADYSAYKPATPTVSARGGSKRVRLTWNAVENADGYYIYSRPSTSSAYQKTDTVTGKDVTEYVKKSLTQDVTYYFRVSAYTMVNKTAVEGDLSASVSATTASVAKTSTAAKKYKTKEDFQKSPAYKKYDKMKSYMKYSKSFAIPGMKNTNVAGFANTSMVPQGICLAGSYLLISAYDYNGTDYSVIYVVNKSAKTYVTSIVLPSKAKVGGLAYDGKNVWVSKGSSVGCFPYSVVTDAATNGKAFTELKAYTSICKVDTTAGFLGYYDGILWVGKTNNSDKSTMYGYRISNADTLPTLQQTYTMSAPSKTQGITFETDGTLILSRSYRTNKSKSGYISKIKTFSPSYNTVTGGQIKKNSARKVTTMPPMVEGVAIYGSYTYTLFSSSHYSSCKYPVDRVIALKTSKLI